MLAQYIIYLFFDLFGLSKTRQLRIGGVKRSRRNLKKVSFDWKFKGLVSLLIVESDWRATNLPPPMPMISPNASYQSFEIAILFKVVKRSGNCVVEDDDSSPPQPSGLRL